MFLRKVHDLRNFGLGNLVGKYPTLSDTAIVDVQHNLGGLFGIFRKEPFKNMYNKLHWCEIIIQ